MHGGHVHQRPRRGRSIQSLGPNEVVMRDFESLGQYHDLWAWIVLSAPDNFMSVTGAPVDQEAEFRNSFKDLRDGFHLAEKRVKNERLAKILRELLSMSESAYAEGNTKRGAHILQECEGFIWPSRAGDLKYVVEAEQRAFGALELFKDVFVSPYPYEGKLTDLGEGQRELLRIAEAHVAALLKREEDFKWFLWILDSHGAIRQEKQKSWRKAEALLRDGFTAGTIAAYARAELSFGGFGGSLSYTLEEQLRPQVSARAIMRNWKHDGLRFHLENPYLTNDSWLRKAKG
jgi:hypothetical protein